MNSEQFDLLVKYIDASCNFSAVEYGSAPGGVHAARKEKQAAEAELRSALVTSPSEAEGN